MKRGERLERRTRLKRGRRRPAAGTRDERQEFRDVTLAAAGRLCAVEDDGYCEGDLQAHHVTSQEAIKRWAKTLDLSPKSLASVLWDANNGLAVCRRHHDRHTLARRRIPLAAVPPAAVGFAAALGLERLLESQYRKPDEEE